MLMLAPGNPGGGAVTMEPVGGGGGGENAREDRINRTTEASTFGEHVSMMREKGGGGDI
jgi:hypothetical protein